MRLMGANGYPKRTKYRKALEEKTKDFCKAHGCSEAFQREIQEMVPPACASLSLTAWRSRAREAAHGPPRFTCTRTQVHEDMHASQGWYRIFPTGEDSAHTRAFKKDPVYSKSLTPLDWLMFKWIETKWTPKHTHDVNGTVRLE